MDFSYETKEIERRPFPKKSWNKLRDKEIKQRRACGDNDTN